MIKVAPFAAGDVFRFMALNIRRHIMVADSAQFAEAVAHMLTRRPLSYQVQLVPDGSVLREIEHSRPALAILSASDHHRKLCRQIKRRFDDLPVLILADPDALDGAVKAGADDVAPLPPREAEIRHRVETLVQLHERILALESHNRELELALEAQQAELEILRRESRDIGVLKRSIKENVMHEIKTPLLQMKSAITMLDVEMRDAPELERFYKFLDYATQAVSRLEGIVQNIAQLAAAFSFKSEPFRVIDAANTALRQLGRSWTAAKKVSQIEVQISEKLPLVQADRNGIGQVLYQLAENALKFSPEGQPVRIVAVPENDGVRVAVIDWGIGIDPELLRTIFEEFYMIDPSSTRPYGGVGVGLAVVKVILDSLGIEIEVRSIPSEGSEFSFRLPYAPLD